MELYKELAEARGSLKNTYEDVLGAEGKALDIAKRIQEFVVKDDELTTSTGQKVNDARNAVVKDFEKFFGEKLDPTVPEPFYAVLAMPFLYAKIYSQQNTITGATKEAIRALFMYGSVETVIGCLNPSDFQEWIFDLNVSEKDDFNTWFANLLVEVSHEIKDKRFNRVASYVIDVLHLEASRELEARENGLTLWRFSAAQEPGGKESDLVFSTRYFELDGQRHNGAMITEIQFATESHTRHSGFVSSDSMYTRITVFLEIGSQYTRYEFMGSSEAVINDSRVSNQRGMEALASIYEVTDGGHGFSSSGFRTSYSIGYWF